MRPTDTSYPGARSPGAPQSLDARSPDTPPRGTRHVPVDPRFRRRWAEARRAEGRRRLRLLLAVASCGAVAGGLFGIAHSPLLRARDVKVIGDSHTSLSTLLAAARLAPGDGTLMISAGSPAAVRAVDALPWVSSVSFHRDWPWTVVLRVTARVPAAIVEGSARVEVIDRTGRVLEVVKQSDAPSALPVVTGALLAVAGHRVLPAPGTSQGALGAEIAAAAACPPALAARHLVLSYSATLGGLVARVGQAQALVLLGDQSQMELKMAVLAELVQRVVISGYAQVDLTAPDRPALTPLAN